MNSADLKRLLFFWLLSFGLAVPGFYLLSHVMPGGYVFGRLFRMLLYHYAHPIPYIAITCFFYGILATAFSERINASSFYGRITWVAVIILITIILSSPFGGMLWHFHDMQAGFFPNQWLWKLISDGLVMGFQYGWLIIALSIPYTIFGMVICYFLTVTGARMFNE